MLPAASTSRHSREHDDIKGLISPLLSLSSQHLLYVLLLVYFTRVLAVHVGTHETVMKDTPPGLN